MNQEQIDNAHYAEILREGLKDADPEFAAQIMEANCPTTEVVGQKVSSTKFHQVFGKELSVALESTLDPYSDKELEIDPKLYNGNRDLIFHNGDCWRVYHPAESNGDISTDQEITINFFPWFSGPEVLYSRLTFRTRPITGKTFRWLRFGRFQSEDTPKEKPFGFDSAKSPFISLDFFSKRNDKFLPLFVKVKMESSEFIYFVIEGQWNVEAVILKIHRVTESEAPPHLVMAKP